MEVMRVRVPPLEFEVAETGEKFGDPAIDGIRMPVPREGDLFQLLYIVRGGKAVFVGADCISIPPPGESPRVVQESQPPKPV